MSAETITSHDELLMNSRSRPNEESAKNPRDLSELTTLLEQIALAVTHSELNQALSELRQWANVHPQDRDYLSPLVSELVVLEEASRLDAQYAALLGLSPEQKEAREHLRKCVVTAIRSEDADLDNLPEARDAVIAWQQIHPQDTLPSELLPLLDTETQVRQTLASFPEDAWIAPKSLVAG